MFLSMILLIDVVSQCLIPTFEEFPKGVYIDFALDTYTTTSRKVGEGTLQKDLMMGDVRLPTKRHRRRK